MAPSIMNKLKFANIFMKFRMYALCCGTRSEIKPRGVDALVEKECENEIPKLAVYKKDKVES